MDLSPVVFEPVAPHTHTVVFLHGRGDNATQFSSSLAYSRDSGDRSLVEAFPSFRWVFPQAPLRTCASMPGIVRQWFDVWNVRDFADREELQLEGLREIVPLIRDILAAEATRLRGRWDRVVLAGISMGAATAAHTLFNLDIPAQGGGRLAAFMGFSCRCPFAGRSLAGMREVLGLREVPQHHYVLRDTPVLLEHCVDDPLVPVANGRGMRDTLVGFGARIEWREYPTGGHWFHSPDGMDDAVRFLNRHVVGDAGGAMDLS
ncbi:Phospholipase/carboxylesterase [Plectosphaerella cucumerina]|jgi:predicted esterase|uniref:Phospholipase/carboxylesterase n=1 Tax=Plectosphaerella cucumerina TaxID=40658 RepID=A0A8K0X8V9_9PEZI|nr:Phospholipase/carboxylesterase [Plectosphaerella cucumerina]